MTHSRGRGVRRVATSRGSTGVAGPRNKHLIGGMQVKLLIGSFPLPSFSRCVYEYLFLLQELVMSWQQAARHPGSLQRPPRLRNVYDIIIQKLISSVLVSERVLERGRRGSSSAFVLTDGDLTPRNILVKDGIMMYIIA